MNHPLATRHALAAALLLVGGAIESSALGAQAPSDRGASTAAVLAARMALGALSDSTRREATFSFDSTERSNWFYVPIDRKGVTLARMTADARARVDSLLLTGLSPRGFATAKSIIRHESILHAIEAAGPPEMRRFVRDSNKYYLSFFGEPDASTAWGWRVEGHHLSVNYTEIGRSVQVVSPVFFGANPARVPSGPKAGLRILAAEEDLARDLVKMLDAAQRKVAIFSDTALAEIETRNDPKARALKTEGLRAADMTAKQRAQLRRLLDHYAGRVSATARAHAMRDIEDGGFGELRFAWAGGTEVGQAHYYRVHGPTVLVEYDNQQTNANHIHTVWRDLRHDFGGDLLAEHYKAHKHVHPAR
ncbi:MAG TPA: DUF3500 domain-containing protein [Gemmatimonadaceae bacterium]|nr:DUF3500 domain-containing protein [Gemmatimonadaceae bacterium]